jgi:predicted double-glycine peptidase
MQDSKLGYRTPIAAAMLIALGCAAHTGWCGSVQIPMQAGGFSIPATSLKESKFRSTIRQQYDFSCGSAALSTLLTHHYDYPVSEQFVFEEMFRNGNRERIRVAGFSLLDIKRFLENHGFQANGFEAPLEKLESARIPAIVLLNERGYAHFVVVKGIRADRVLIGDPAGGTRTLARAAFEAAWMNRILFVVTNKTDIARFNAASDWRVSPIAPIARGVNRQGLDNLTMPKLGSSDF